MIIVYTPILCSVDAQHLRDDNIDKSTIHCGTGVVSSTT